MEEDYTPHWMILKSTLDTVLTQTPGTYKPISYEQMYSAVYKCVCKHHSETLHMDLIQHVEGILKNWSQNLESHVRKDDRHNFITEVDSIMNQYFNALSSIVPIFTYLNRFYIESRLNTNLNSQLLHLFEKQITSPYINQILGKYFIVFFLVVNSFFINNYLHIFRLSGKCQRFSHYTSYSSKNR